MLIFNRACELIDSVGWDSILTDDIDFVATEIHVHYGRMYTTRSALFP